ncbi:MAG: S1C family serine protease [Zavarzinella sp.]
MKLIGSILLILLLQNFIIAQDIVAIPHPLQLPEQLKTQILDGKVKSADYRTFLSQSVHNPTLLRSYLLELQHTPTVSLGLRTIGANAFFDRDENYTYFRKLFAERRVDFVNEIVACAGTDEVLLEAARNTISLQVQLYAEINKIRLSINQNIDRYDSIFPKSLIEPENANKLVFVRPQQNLLFDPLGAFVSSPACYGDKRTGAHKSILFGFDESQYAITRAPPVFSKTIILANQPVQFFGLNRVFTVIDGDCTLDKISSNGIQSYNRVDYSLMIVNGDLNSRIGFPCATFAVINGNVKIEQTSSVEYHPAYSMLFSKGKLSSDKDYDSKKYLCHMEPECKKLPLGIRFFELSDVGLKLAVKDGVVTIAELSKEGFMAKTFRPGDTFKRVNGIKINNEQDLRRQMRSTVVWDGGIFEMERAGTTQTYLVKPNYFDLKPKK